MGVRRWLTLSVLPRCPRLGLPEGEGFRLDPRHEPLRLGAFPRPLIATRPAAAGHPPALARQAVHLADDEHRELGLAPRFGFLVHGAEDGAQRPHLGPRET